MRQAQLGQKKVPARSNDLRDAIALCKAQRHNLTGVAIAGEPLDALYGSQFGDIGLQAVFVDRLVGASFLEHLNALATLHQGVRR